MSCPSYHLCLTCLLPSCLLFVVLPCSLPFLRLLTCYVLSPLCCVSFLFAATEGNPRRINTHPYWTFDGKSSYAYTHCQFSLRNITPKKFICLFVCLNKTRIVKPKGLRPPLKQNLSVGSGLQVESGGTIRWVRMRVVSGLRYPVSRTSPSACRLLTLAGLGVSPGGFCAESRTVLGKV